MNEFISIHYFKKGHAFNANELKENSIKIITVRASDVYSISGRMRFNLPFSGAFIGNFGVIELSNGDDYSVSEEELARIRKKFRA